jgi:hypothetical protein
MRCCFSLALCLLLAGCAELTEPKVIIKKIIVVREPISQSGRADPPPPVKKIVRVYIDLCPAKEELQDHCAKFRHDEAGCEAEQRCKWYRSDKITSHCQSIYCKPTGNRYRRED